MRTLILTVLAFTATACIHQRVASESSSLLRCPAAQISVHDEHPDGTWWVAGCGRAAVCSLPNVDGAEIQCAGGAPTLRASAD